MFYHLVLFDLVSNDSETQRQVKDELLRLTGLPSVLELTLSGEAGFTHGTSAGDIALFSRFASSQAYHIYMVDEVHEEVKRATAPYIESKQIIDFEA